MSFIINQNFDLKSPQFNFARDYYENLDALKAACGNDWNNYSSFPNHFITNVGGTLYQYTESNSKDVKTGKWRKLEFGKTVVDTTFSTSSTNPVENRVITTELNRFSTAVEQSLNDKASKDVATTTANGLLSSADKVKLNNLASNANNFYVAKSEMQTLSDEEINTLWNEAK